MQQISFTATFHHASGFFEEMETPFLLSVHEAVNQIVFNPCFVNNKWEQLFHIKINEGKVANHVN